jgi:putative Mg2+ transporter-C (MgtC) family protein
MDIWITPGEIATRLALAIVLGGLLGFEREYRHKAAGLRTHMMVALGATTFTLVTLELFHRTAVDGAVGGASVDPTRVIQGIIGGIGFLGAGSIIQGRGSVAGLTTAGSLWFVGSIGVAVGGGHYVVAGLAAAAGLLVLAGIGLLKRFFPDGQDEDRGRCDDDQG